MEYMFKVQPGSGGGGGQGAAALDSVEVGCRSRKVLGLSSALYLQGKAPRHHSHLMASPYLESHCLTSEAMLFKPPAGTCGILCF